MVTPLARRLHWYEAAEGRLLRPLSLAVVGLAVLVVGGAAYGSLAPANGLIAYVRPESSPSWIWVVRPDGARAREGLAGPRVGLLAVASRNAGDGHGSTSRGAPAPRLAAAAPRALTAAKTDQIQSELGAEAVKPLCIDRLQGRAPLLRAV